MILHSLVFITDIKCKYEFTPLPKIHTINFYILYLPECKMTISS